MIWRVLIVSSGGANTGVKSVIDYNEALINQLIEMSEITWRCTQYTVLSNHINNPHRY